MTKSAAHFRAGFESWAGAVHVVSEPGVHNLGQLPDKRLRRNLYPLDEPDGGPGELPARAG